MKPNPNFVNTIAQPARRRKSPMRDAVLAALPRMAKEFTASEVAAEVRKAYKSRTALGRLENPISAILAQLVGTNMLRRRLIFGGKARRKYIYRKPTPADLKPKAVPLAPVLSSKEQAWNNLRASMGIKSSEN